MLSVKLLICQAFKCPLENYHNKKETVTVIVVTFYNKPRILSIKNIHFVFYFIFYLVTAHSLEKKKECIQISF